ncbi:hypothetical protein RJ640_028230 [Escallonia rubra]|uniref:OTU domain-containing protein n=1 Tax=Escallonia rubra TaxID=112253 RepID=A0AA88UB84_9ASTE|nr:hypothetical protein RJ640_028230 [Escallonia rubra]
MTINGTQSIGECSSSTSASSQQDVEDDRMIAVVLSEEYAKLDGALGRRLSNLAPVAHVPRINTFIPNLSDATLDHQRLLQRYVLLGWLCFKFRLLFILDKLIRKFSRSHPRLNIYGLHEVKVSGDGNCQFRALSDQIYRSPEYHKHVRKEVVKQLKDSRPLYEGYVPMKYKHYYKKMAKETCFIEITPQHQTPKRVDAMGFCGGLRLFWKEEVIELEILPSIDPRHNVRYKVKIGFLLAISAAPNPSAK